jgi:hypothetical protein
MMGDPSGVKVWESDCCRLVNADLDRYGTYFAVQGETLRWLIVSVAALVLFSVSSSQQYAVVINRGFTEYLGIFVLPMIAFGATVHFFGAPFLSRAVGPLSFTLGDPGNPRSRAPSSPDVAAWALFLARFWPTWPQRLSLGIIAVFLYVVATGVAQSDWLFRALAMVVGVPSLCLMVPRSTVIGWLHGWGHTKSEFPVYFVIILVAMFGFGMWTVILFGLLALAASSTVPIATLVLFSGAIATFAALSALDIIRWLVRDETERALLDLRARYVAGRITEPQVFDCYSRLVAMRAEGPVRALILDAQVPSASAPGTGESTALMGPVRGEADSASEVEA